MAGGGRGYSPLSLLLFPLRYPKEKGKFSIFSTFSSNSSTSGFSAQWNVVTLRIAQFVSSALPSKQINSTVENNGYAYIGHLSYHHV